MPAISVIVPVYNVEKYLNRCVDSILAQTFADFELILVDDGSPDQSGAICDEYTEKDSRIKVVHKGNGGASSARNTGLDIARGQYIVFVDSDDWVQREMLYSMIRLMEVYNADIVEMGFYIVRETIDELNKNTEEEIVALNGLKAAESLYEDTFFGINLLWGKLYSSSLFHELRFPEGRVCEDISVVYKLFLKSKAIISSSKKVYYYYQSGESVMRGSFKAQRYNDGVTAFEEISDYAKSNELKRLYDLNQISLIGATLKAHTLLLSNGFKDEAKQMLRKFRLIEFSKNTEMSLKLKINYTIFQLFPIFAKNRFH